MIKVITEPTVEPVGLDEVKLHLRLPDSDIEDSLLAGLITAAREHCERYTGKTIASQTLELVLDRLANEIVLPGPPVQSVTSVTYKDSTGTETTVSADDYAVDTDTGVIRPVQSWPSFTPWPVSPVRIRYEAGYTTPPQQIKQAIMLLVGHWYENRENSSEIVGGKQHIIDFAVKALLTQHKVRWWDR